jgi:hypothetical protein
MQRTKSAGRIALAPLPELERIVVDDILHPNCGFSPEQKLWLRGVFPLPAEVPAPEKSK